MGLRAIDVRAMEGDGHRSLVKLGGKKDGGMVGRKEDRKKASRLVSRQNLVKTYFSLQFTL